MRHSRHLVSLKTFGLAFAIALSPALMQGEPTCAKEGDTTLSSFELEVLGQNHIAFDPAQRVYYVWLPSIADTAIVRAYSTDREAEVTYQYRDSAEELIDAGSFSSFNGGGQTTLDGLLASGESYLRIFVKTPGTTFAKNYTAILQVGCSDCDDGIACTQDGCDPALEVCVHPPEPTGTACDAGGVPGVCTAGNCLEFCSVNNCEDGNWCTVDSCDPVLGVCEHAPAGDGNLCVDVDGGFGTCHAGNCACSHSCDDGNDCTSDGCDVPSDLCTYAPVTDGALCSGGRGICHGGNCACAQGCDDVNACTLDVCSPAADQCENTPVADGTACPGGGSCQAGSCVGGAFPCTEQGIRDAVAAGGGPHVFDCAGPTTVEVVAGPIVIDNDVILNGAGELTVGLSSTHVFEVAAGVTAELHGFAIEPGMGMVCDWFCYFGRGCCSPAAMDGIHNLGTLTLANSSVTGGGSGILNGDPYGDPSTDMATLTVIRSTLSGNVYGIQSLSSGVLTVTSSTVYGNTAGGIHISGAGAGTVAVTNSTVSGNAGIGISAGSGQLTVTNTTLTGNTPNVASYYGVGVALGNTIVDGGCAAALTSLGYNIESPGNSCGFDAATDQFDVTHEALALGLLEDNGGPTLTHALLAGSVAIDWIQEASCELTTDQRGVTRPQGDGCDVGAYEYADCAGSACDDGNVCTTDNCDPLSLDPWCVNTHVPDRTGCDFFGLAGVCSSGTCIEDNCIDPAICDDGNECTVDSCDPLSNPWCANDYVADGTSCDFSGLAGVCSSGVCIEDNCVDPAICDDGNECTVDSCDPLSNPWCSSAPGNNGADCDAGGAVGVCSAGGCVATSWGTAELVETDPAPVSIGSVAVDPSGNVTAVWEQGSDVWSNRYMPGAGWGVAELIGSPGSAPQVAVDSTGVATAVWAAGSDTWSSRYVPGVGWGAAELLEADDSSAVAEPRVAVSSSGAAIAVWRQGPAGNESIWSNRYAPGLGWGTAELVELEDWPVTDGLRVRIDAAGDATVVWRQRDSASGDYRVWSNRYVSGTGWGIAELVSAASAPALNPDLAVDPDGNVTVVWEQFGGSRWDLWSRRHEPGLGWGAPEMIVSPGRGPRIAVDAAGQVTVLWGLTDIWSSRYTPGVGWGVFELVGNGSYPWLAVEPSGRAIAVWTSGLVWSRRYTPGVGWGAAEPVPGASGQTLVIIDASGAATAGWVAAGDAWANRSDSQQ